MNCNGLGKLWMKRKSSIVLFNNHMNASDYRKVLNNQLLPVSEDIGGSCFMFDEVNAPIHSTSSAFDQFLSNCVHTISWFS